MSINTRRSFYRRARLFQVALVVFCFSVFVAVCLLTGAVESPPKAMAGSANLIELTPGAPIVRQIAAGGKELFEISLRPGQFLRLSIDKGDLALSLMVYDPSGNKLIEEVSHGYEVLELSLPTDSAGMYRLEISSLEREGNRQYQLRVEPIKAATPEDRKASIAQQAIARASFLRADWTEKSLRHAVENYDVAATIWLSSRDLRRAAVASMKAGRVCFVLGAYRDALKRYQKAADEAESAGAKLEEAEALSQIGLLYSYLGKNDRAEESLVRALEVLGPEKTGNQPAIVKQAYGQALNNLGEVNYSKGNLVKSSEHFERALKLFTEVGDRVGEARVHLFKGYIAGGIGQPEKAVAEISEALALFQFVSDKTGEGLCLTALGLSHSLKRDEEHAIKLHREARDIFRTIGDRQSEAITLNAMGQAYEFLSEYPMALENYREALRLFQENGGLDFAAVSMFKVATIYRLIGDLKQAQTYYEQCLQLSRAARTSRTEANALNDVALIYASQGSRKKTVSQYRKILKYYEAISDRGGQATALNNLGDFLLRIGEKKQALDSYNKALPLSEQAGNKSVLISTLYNIARAHRDLGALENALTYIKQSIKIIEDLRTNVATPEFRTSYFAGVRQHYDLCIDILMQLDRVRPGQGFAAAALLESENARARSLIDILTEAGVDIRKGVAPELVERERELQGLLRAQAQYQMDLSISGKNQAESREVARQIDQLRTECQEIDAQFRDQNPLLLALTKRTPLSVEQIQAELLDRDTILLEYALGEERSYLWVVTADSLRSYELPARATLEDSGREVYKLLTARQAVGEILDGGYQVNVEAADRLYYDKALNLSQLMLGQVSGQLGTKRLLVVTEGVLQYIPLDALPTPPQQAVGSNARDTLLANSGDLPALIATHEIVTLPSITALAAIRQEKRKISSSNKIVAVLADPVFTSNDDRVDNGKPHSATAFSGDQSQGQPALRNFESLVRNGGPMRLVHASEEADAIFAATPRGTGMVAKGFDASRQTAMSSLIAEYRIVHFATHAFLNSEHPELSGIVLNMVNQDGSKTNGFMPLQDIYNLNLSADLVVLSACDTALGKDIRGEGLVGLTRSFMSAGSRSVVASLWKVDDRATALLMADFYKAMLHDGLPPAAALRSAKQKIRQEKAWSAPYFWAGFVLQGEYNERIVVERKSWLGIASAGSLALVVISSGLLILRRRRRTHLARP
jgi:CHAT domain-containing protein/Tfp pilus assembly protein PilF